jgi:hypothetical protein
MLGIVVRLVGGYDPAMSSKPSTCWPGWLGALVLVVVVYGPAALAADDLLLVHGSWSIQLGACLAMVPGMALIGLLAPLTGHRRRSAFVALVPIWGWGRVVEIGYDLATLVPGWPTTPRGRAVLAPAQQIVDDAKFS